MTKKRYFEEPTLFDFLPGTDRTEPLLRLPYRAPISSVHEVTKEIRGLLFKVDDFMCLYQKCPFWLHPCF